MFECIFIPGVSLLHYFMEPHVPDYGNRSPDEDELHCGVVERDVPREQIEVARDEDDDIQFLSLERNTGTGLGGANLEEEDNYAEEVGHVSC